MRNDDGNGGGNLKREEKEKKLNSEEKIDSGRTPSSFSYITKAKQSTIDGQSRLDKTYTHSSVPYS